MLGTVLEALAVRVLHMVSLHRSFHDLHVIFGHHQWSVTTYIFLRHRNGQFRIFFLRYVCLFFLAVVRWIKKNSLSMSRPGASRLLHARQLLARREDAGFGGAIDFMDISWIFHGYFMDISYFKDSSFCGCSMDISWILNYWNFMADGC